MQLFIRLLKTETLRDTLISFVGLGTTTILGFFFTIIMARTLGPEKFGIFSSVIALVSIIYSLGDLGIPPALINFLPKLPLQKNNLIGTAFVAQLMACIFAASVFLVLIYFHRFVVPGSRQNYLLLALLITLSYILSGFAQGVFSAQRRFWKLSANQMIDSVIKIALVIVLLSFSRLDITTALIANVISSFLAFVFTYGREIITLKFHLEMDLLKLILSFSKWIALSRLFSVFIGRVDILILNLLLSSHAAGIFAASSKVTLFFALLISSLNVVVNPRFSGFKTAQETLGYIRKLLLFVIAIAVVMLLCAVFASPIILTVFGQGYREAIFVFRYLTLAMLPFLFSLITTPAIIYTFNRPDLYAKITAVQVGLIIAIDLLFIPQYGVLAPVVATAVSNIFVLIISSLKLKQLLSLAQLTDESR